jgi:hypothetical protein
MSATMRIGGKSRISESFRRPENSQKQPEVMVTSGQHKPHDRLTVRKVPYFSVGFNERKDALWTDRGWGEYQANADDGRSNSVRLTTVIKTRWERKTAESGGY